MLDELARAEDLSRLDIVTLNHDLLVETFLRDQGHQIIDGFGAQTADSVRFFNPSLFENPQSKIRLLKVHGSIDWHLYLENQCAAIRQPLGLPDGYDLFAIPSSLAAPPTDVTAPGHTPAKWKSGPHFLTGTHNKLSDYSYGIFRSNCSVSSSSCGNMTPWS